MTDDNATVVFVGAPDLADLTRRTKQRISQLVMEMERDGSRSVLPKTSFSINSKPAWLLSSIIPTLEQAGYAISELAIKKLEADRAVPTSTIPVGVTEAAEVLAVSVATLRGRSARGYIVPPLFRFGRDKVWDLDTLVADSLTRGFPVDEGAVATWRGRNCIVAKPPLREVERIVRIRALASAVDDEAARQSVDRHLRGVLTAPMSASTGSVHVIDVKVDDPRR